VEGFLGVEGVGWKVFWGWKVEGVGWKVFWGWKVEGVRGEKQEGENYFFEKKCVAYSVVAARRLTFFSKIGLSQRVYFFAFQTQNMTFYPLFSR
jgi:hypothetical protein